MPLAKGMAIPPADTAKAVFPVRRTIDKSDFHPGQKEQQQNSELSDRIDHRPLFRACRKQRTLQTGPESAKYRRPQQDPGDQLAHYRRLTEALHKFAQQPTADEQRNYLG
jgi:hypothetical protein